MTRKERVERTLRGLPVDRPNRHRVRAPRGCTREPEATDLENLPTALFEERIRTALKERPGGKGFVLMPSACPYGRTLTPNVLPNYQAMIRLAEEMAD